MDKILPISKSRLLDYSDALVENFWLLRPASYAASPAEIPPFPAQLQQLLGKQPGVLLVLSRQVTHPLLLAALLKAAQAGTRVYLLSSERIASIKELAGNCLMRFGATLHGAYLLADPQTNPRGLYCDDAFTQVAIEQGKCHLVELDPAQCQLAFQHFCYHFWNSAKEEVIDRNAQPQPVPAAPPFSLLKPLDHIDGIRAQLAKGEIKTVSAAPSIWPLEQLKKADILTQDSVQDPITLGQHNGNLCVSDGSMPLHLLLGNTANYLLPLSMPSTAGNAFVLPLNDAQTAYFEKKFIGYSNQAARIFVPKSSRKQLISQQIVRIGNDTAPQQVRAEQTYPHELHAASFVPLSELEAMTPGMLDNGLVCQQHHQWTIHPFRLPSAAKKDSLYDSWTKQHADMQRAFQTLDQRIDSLLNSKLKLSANLLTKLKQVFLGKEQRWSELRAELASLQAKPWETMPSAQYLPLVRQLNGIAQKLDLSDLELQAHKAHAEKTTDWESRTKQKAEEVAALTAQVTEKQTTQKAAEAKESTELNALEKALEEFLSKYKLTPEQLPAQKSKWEQASGKNQRKSKPEEAAKADEMLRQLEKCDPKVLQARQRSDQAQREKTLKSLESQLKSKTDEWEKLKNDAPKFSLDMEASSDLDQLHSEKDTPKPSKTLLGEVLPEDLPATGKLYQLDKQRFLAIQLWSEVASATTEAARLKAKLCVQP
jgi:hypothetical protein